MFSWSSTEWIEITNFTHYLHCWYFGPFLIFTRTRYRVTNIFMQIIFPIVQLFLSTRFLETELLLDQRPHHNCELLIHAAELCVGNVLLVHTVTLRHIATCKR